MTKTVKLRILDEANCVFVGFDDIALDYFYEEYAVFAPNYYFNPKYTIGSWDGKIRYFTKTGKTYVNLLDSILPKVQAIGYKIELEDLRVRTKDIPDADIHKDSWKHVNDLESGEPIEIRYYQVDAVFGSEDSQAVGTVFGCKDLMISIIKLARQHFKYIRIVVD